MAEIGWIDFSKKDRNRVNTILQLLTPEGQVDELGIGTIRDGLSNRLFPGISTIQTRAKYFFIIPYILWDFLKLPTSERKAKKAIDYLQEQEDEVMWDLADMYRNTEGSSGVIGVTMKRELKERLVRRPSDIYWNGLNVMNFLDSKGLSANAFLSRSDKANLEALTHAVDEAGRHDDKDADFSNLFNLKVRYDENWRKELSLQLTKSEAAFLKDQMLSLHGSMLQFLMQNEEAARLFVMPGQNFVSFARALTQFDLPPTLKGDLILAHDFAVYMEGAHLAYNQLLHEDGSFQQQWDVWYAEFERSLMGKRSAFSIETLKAYAPTTRHTTLQFVQDWVELVHVPALNESKKRELIVNQEYKAKGKKARLMHNNRDGIEPNKRVGLNQLEFRFGKARNIISDLINALNHA